MRILVADDDELIRAQWEDWAESESHKIEVACDGKEAVDKAKKFKPFICILDLIMPKMDGIEALRQIKFSLPDTEVIMVTGSGDVRSAVTAMREGAYDYLIKPVSFQEAEATIQRAVERRELVVENRSLRLELGKEVTDSALVGQASVMLKLRERIEQAAGSSASVLIRGESGTGKELVARLVHQHSKRAGGPFVAVNIAALSESLLESEMFGHEKNAFTGATEQKKGRFERADGGTLLLDEISEIPMHQQVKFLRVIQEGEVDRVGGASPIRIDARIISTTNRDLDAQVRDQKFREDLFYRLNVLSINIPPLRERKEDIPLLAEHYLKVYNARDDRTIGSIAPEALDKLVEFDWPGNVRELMHCIESAVVIESGGALSLESVMASKVPELSGEGEAEAGSATLREIEKDHIQRILGSTSGDKKKTASVLGISRTTLYQKIKEYGF